MTRWGGRRSLAAIARIGDNAPHPEAPTMTNDPGPSYAVTPGRSPVSRARWQGVLIGFVAGLLVGGLAGVMLPELSQQRPAPGGGPARKAPSLPPAPVTIKTVGEGLGRAIHIENTGDKPLIGASLRASSPRGRGEATLDLGTLGPKEARDVRDKDWEWRLAPGDVLEVTAEGFSAATFTER